MEQDRGAGRTLLAAIFLTIAGVLNIIWGIAAIGNSHFFAHNVHYVFASLKGWGWVALIVGILELIAATSLVSGHSFGRWFAVIVGSIAAVDALLSIPAYPFWSLAVFLLSLWIVYGLIEYNPSAAART